MFWRLKHMIQAPRKLREAELFLKEWAPEGVEVVNDGKTCWLSYKGMIYSFDYSSAPEEAHVPYMTEHLENHKWCLKIAGDNYTRRGLVEAWANKYLPSSHLIGACGNDIVYTDETKDRPIWPEVGRHTVLYLIHNKKFVLIATEEQPLPSLVYSLVRKTHAIANGKGFYLKDK